MNWQNSATAARKQEVEIEDLKGSYDGRTRLRRKTLLAGFKKIITTDRLKQSIDISGLCSTNIII